MTQCKYNVSVMYDRGFTEIEMGFLGINKHWFSSLRRRQPQEAMRQFLFRGEQI